MYKDTRKSGKCSVCHREKSFEHSSESKIVCPECMSWYDDYTCDICKTVIGLFGAYEEHLRTKHTVEELARLTAARAKKEKETIV